MAGPLDEMVSRFDQRRVVEAIRRAEHRSSGQVKVHVEKTCSGDARVRAEKLFGRLGLSRTRHRNAAFIYVAVADRKFALLGDIGIHESVGSGFWEAAATRMKEAFARGAIGDGLVGAIDAIGEKLAERFPADAPAVNELPDDISH